MKVGIGPRVAGEKELKHPAAIIGDIAEVVRSNLHKKGAKPPGLKTSINSDGSMVVVAENPEVGIFVQVTIALLEVTQPQVQSTPQPLNEAVLPNATGQATLSPGVGVGPPLAPVTPQSVGVGPSQGVNPGTTV